MGSSLNSLGTLSLDVGGTPASVVETLQLALGAGQVLSQLIQNSSLDSVGLGLNAHQLAAVVGSQVVGLAVDLEGGQLSNAHVLAQLLQSVGVVPGTGNNNSRGNSSGEVSSLAGVDVNAGGQQLLRVNGQLGGIGEELRLVVLDALEIAVDPGIVAFLTDRLSVELNVGIFGVSYKWKDQVRNQVSNGDSDSTSAGFMLNLLSLGVGLSYYFL
jgi:hypothetical protein